MKIAAIDIGSNSVRLMMMVDGKTIYKKLHTTRLGQGVQQTGMLISDAIERTAQAVAKFVCVANTEQADKIYAFATAAVRSSLNRQMFLDRVYQLCGITIDVISGEEEAKIGILGALKGKDGGIIDVGGASTEVNLQQFGKTLFSKSVNVGTIRVHDACGREEIKIDQFLMQKVAEYGAMSAKDLPVYAIGGTATTIAAVHHQLEVYDPAITDGTIVTKDEIDALAKKFLTMPVEEIKMVKGMEPGRADVIGGGCKIMSAVMEHFHISQIIVCESDNLEGYVYLKEGIH